MTTKRATITIPAFHLAEEERGGKRKNYVVYHVRVQNIGLDKTVYRRYTNFEELHESFSAMFPNLADLHPLPNNARLLLDNPKYVIMNTAEKAEARRKKLEAYLHDLIQVDSLLDHFVAFLQLNDGSLPTASPAADSHGHGSPHHGPRSLLKMRVAAPDEDLLPRPAARLHDSDEKSESAPLSPRPVLPAL
jgi:hypothetical protein